MGGRAWSQEELIRLEELTETYRRIHGEHRYADQEHPLADPGS